MKNKLKDLAFASLLSAIVMYVPESEANQCKVNFSDEQIHVMQKAFDYGKPFGYNYSLAAIAWRESSAGINNVRVETFGNSTKVSYSPFHILLSTAMTHEECKTRHCASKIIDNLMNDFDYAASHAVQTLDYWYQVKDGNWLEVWKGYNGGYTNSVDSKLYAIDIKEKIDYLQRCIRL